MSSPQYRDISIAELRRLTQGRQEPPVYVPARWVSIYVSWLLVRTPLTPNGVTLLWGGCLLGSAAMFAMGGVVASWVAAALIVSAYVLDCVDGEVARMRGVGSNVGSLLEQIVHWSTNLIVLAGAAVGCFQRSQDVTYLMLGLAVIIGDATFHFMYVSLRVASSPGAQYGFLAHITRWQYLLMPITTNILLVGVVVSRIDVALWVWAVWSNLAWVSGFTMFFLAERRLEPLTAIVQEALTLAQQPAPSVDGEVGSKGSSGAVARLGQ